MTTARPCTKRRCVLVLGLGYERPLKAVTVQVTSKPRPQRAACGHTDFPSISSNEWVCELPGQAEAGCSRSTWLSSLPLAAQGLEPPYGQHLLEDTSPDSAHREAGPGACCWLAGRLLCSLRTCIVLTHLPFYWFKITLFFTVSSHSC